VQKKLAIIGYSFGYRIDQFGQKTPGPVNKALAQEVEKLHQEVGGGLVVLQGEIADCVKEFKPDLVVRAHRFAGEYLDSEELTIQASVFLRQHGVNQVWLVAYSGLHRAKCRQLLRIQGFQVQILTICKIPYDTESAQWWTRSLLKEVWYSILQILIGRKGR